MAETLRDLYVTGLTNAHAVETQAIQLLQRQVERLENYPALSERMTRHIEESRTQAARLERILGQMGTSHSGLKDAGLGLMGNLAALAHAPAKDEVMKNSFANFAFEHFEIASYRALLVMAKEAGDATAAPLLQQSLDEELAMAKWLADHMEETTRTYLHREVSGQTAGL